jgi:hypothetical protein
MWRLTLRNTPENNIKCEILPSEAALALFLPQFNIYLYTGAHLGEQLFESASVKN